MAAMVFNRTTLLAVIGSILLAGCGPREESGPLPLTTASTPVKRITVVRGPFTFREHHTLWDFGEGPVEPMERIGDLRNAVPDQLIQQLELTKIGRREAGGRPFERIAYDGHATVVSLDPDIMIVTIREIPDIGTEDLFAGWHGDFRHPSERKYLHNPPRTRHEYIHNHREMIGTLGTTLSYYAGPLVPWSSEMYAVSSDPAVVAERLTFVDDRMEIPFAGGRLVGVHKDDSVMVERR